MAALLASRPHGKHSLEIEYEQMIIRALCQPDQGVQRRLCHVAAERHAARPVRSGPHGLTHRRRAAIEEANVGRG